MPDVYPTTNDYDYLVNEVDWKDRMRTRLVLLFRSVEEGAFAKPTDSVIEIVLTGLQEMLNEIRDSPNKKRVRPNLVGRGALLTYLVDKDLPTELSTEHKKEIESCFFATFIREMLLEEYSINPHLINSYIEERANFRDRLMTDYAEVPIDTSDNTELIYLYRFERAVLKLFEITHKMERKLSLKVGNLLEGTSDTKRYIIGGRSAKDTVRRLDLIECLAKKVLPEELNKPRKKRSNLGETTFPSSSSSILPTMNGNIPVNGNNGIGYEYDESDFTYPSSMMYYPTAPITSSAASSSSANFPFIYDPSRGFYSTPYSPELMNFPSTGVPYGDYAYYPQTTHPSSILHPPPLSLSPYNNFLPVNNLYKKMRTINLDYTNIARAGGTVGEDEGGRFVNSDGNGMSNESSDLPAFDVFAFHHILETNPNIIFVGFSILNSQHTNAFTSNANNDIDIYDSSLFKDKKEIYHSLIPVDNKLSSSSSSAAASSALSLLVVYEKAIHLKEKRKYLLKIFPFYSLQKYQEDQIRKEKELLKYFNSLGSSSSIEEGNTNIIKLIDCNLLTSRQSDKMNFFVLEWMDLSLQEYWDSLINERKDFASSVMERYDHMIKSIMKDILLAVLLLHKNDIVHR
jgi:hypothetical protein